MDIFTFIKKNISIETVVSEYTTLKRAGNYLKARCPFHHEKTASFTISPGKEIFYCFGCHQGGDVIMFISQLEKCNQRDAALLLAERYNIALPENDFTHAVPREKKDRYFFIHNILSTFFTDRYEKSGEARRYIESRGITEDLRKRFLIGYFPAGKTTVHDLISYAHKQSVLTKELIDTHIIVPSDSFYYSPFEGRLIIPITDALGRICGFGGRIFKPDDTRAKYYNSHENEFFSKGTVLFGLSQAKEDIRQKKSVFIVEGYMDCILMAQYGYKNTVATLGTACTESHLKQLARYSDTLYMTYDGDEAGKNALIRIAEKCWRVNVEPMVLALPKGEDPASYLVKHQTLEPIVETKQDIFSFCISSHATSITQKTLQDKLSSIQSILSLLVPIDDPIKQDVLVAQASKSLGIERELLKKELKKLEKKQTERHFRDQNDVTEKPTEDKDSYEQDAFSRRILGAMFHTIQLLDALVVELCFLSGDKDVGLVAQKTYGYIQNCQKTRYYNFDDLWNHFSESERHIVSLLITQAGEGIDPTSFKQLTQQFERHMFKKGVYYLKVQLAQAMRENNHEKTENILRELVTMQKKFKRETSVS